MSDFKCQADKCPDDCCTRWSVSVDPNTKNLFEKEAPEILKLTEEVSGEVKMIKNQTGNDNTNTCIALGADKLCKIQKEYGPRFLPDICYSYPRSYKRFKNDVYMTSNIGCPESAKHAILAKDGYQWNEVQPERMNSYISDLTRSSFAEQSPENIVGVCNQFLKAIDNWQNSADETLVKLIISTIKLNKVNQAEWINSVEEILNQASIGDIDEKLQEAKNNGFNLQNSLDNLLAGLRELTSDRSKRIKYEEVTNLIYSEAKNYAQIKESWEQGAKESMDKILKNYLKAKLTETLFPIACYFSDIKDELVLIAVQYIYLRLALMCYAKQNEGKISDDLVVTIVQTLERTNYSLKKQKLLNNYKLFMKLDLEKIAALALNY
ncbi:MAG: lysine-N-methylase [Rickettsiaceae bacterium]|nr:lysine-N-methylase [Rickettsiaceae bacterium]